MFKDLNKTKPMTDEQYAELQKLSDAKKRNIIYGFDSREWSQKDIMRHYIAANFPKVTYHSSGGGGVGSLTPPISR
jgi:hypothetical protein